MERRSVLFLCTKNSARSVMAEMLLRREAGAGLEVFSAGLRPEPLHPMTTRVLGEIGINVEGRKPCGVSDYLGRATIHYIVTVCQAAEDACPSIWPFALQQLSWPLDDPAVSTGTESELFKNFRSVRDEIESRVKSWVRELTDQGILHPLAS